MNIIQLLLIVLYTILMSIIAQLANIIDRSFTTYFYLSRVYSRGVLFISGVKLSVKGTENVEQGKTYVYVSNHSSMFDIPALMAAFPGRVSIVFKKELARIPIFGWQLVTGPFILIDRQNPEKAMKSIERAKNLMSNKNISVVLFAEGTRSKTGEVQPFKRGAFYLAARVNHPIIPVAIKGADEIMPKGKLIIKQGTIEVVFGKAIDTSTVKNKNDEIRLMEEVRERIIDMKKGV